jgi:hypothetical protein
MNDDEFLTTEGRLNSHITTYDGTELAEAQKDARTIEEKLGGRICPALRFTSRWQAPYIVEWLQGLGVESTYYKRDDHLNPSEEVIFVPGYKLRLRRTIVVHGPQDVVVYND